jgi:hypothetical protein
MSRSEAQAPLLLAPETRVTCPRCDHEFSLAEGFARKSLEQLEASSQGALAALEAQAREAARVLERRAAVQAEAPLREQLEAQSKQLEDFRKMELALRQERVALDARQVQLELDLQRQLDAGRQQIAEAARAAEAERSRFREADLQQKLNSMREKLEEAQRKAEQGSQQSQGEVLELLLETDIGAAFPIDVIEEVRKGARGGDVRQRVITRSGQQAGTILWEAKRAQNWSAAWPAKLKSDMREAGAEVGVIVTTSYPAGWSSGQLFGLHDEVWVTSASAAIPLAAALRAGLLEAFKARAASANKGEKMEAVYDYLTSPQFAHKLRAVYEAFRKMRQELEVERTTMQQRWNRRIKQIDQATVQLIGIAGDLQGLAQQELPQLEMESDALEGPEAVDGAGADEA